MVVVVNVLDVAGRGGDDLLTFGFVRAFEEVNVLTTYDLLRELFSLSRSFEELIIVIDAFVVVALLFVPHNDFLRGVRVWVGYVGKYVNDR